MKNKALKKLIFLGAIVFLIAGFSYSFAYDSGYRSSMVDLSQNIPQASYTYQPGYGYPNNYNNAQNNYLQQQPYYYVQPAPVAPQVQYVPQQVQYAPQQVQYANPAQRTTTVTPLSITNNKGTYVNYDPNPYNPYVMTGSVYGSNYNQYGTPNVVDDNGVTALSVAGSGSFLPSSIFQWFLFIILILAIIIVARIISKKSANHDAHAPQVH